MQSDRILEEDEKKIRYSHIWDRSTCLPVIPILPSLLAIQFVSSPRTRTVTSFPSLNVPVNPSPKGRRVRLCCVWVRVRVCVCSLLYCACVHVCAYNNNYQYYWLCTYVCMCVYIHTYINVNICVTYKN